MYLLLHVNHIKLEFDNLAFTDHIVMHVKLLQKQLLLFQLLQKQELLFKLMLNQELLFELLLKQELLFKLLLKQELLLKQRQQQMLVVLNRTLCLNYSFTISNLPSPPPQREQEGRSYHFYIRATFSALSLIKPSIFLQSDPIINEILNYGIPNVNCRKILELS